MLNKSNVLNELLQLDYTAQAGGNHFSIIDELHANENAHTRFLASLLSDKTILHSFMPFRHIMSKSVTIMTRFMRKMRRNNTAIFNY